MITVYTIDELESALKRGEKKILVLGSAASAIRAKAKKRKKIKRAAIIGSAAVALAGIALAPLTGGASAAAVTPTVCGLTVGAGGAAAATAATAAGGLTISATELSIIIGGSIAMVALLKGRKVKFNSDGSVLIE